MKLYASDRLTDRAGAYALLERGAMEMWGLSSLPELVREPGGKPRFSDFPNLHFNLSHSGSFALCALGDSPVGVDIQIVKDTWREGLPRRVCSREELVWLEGQADRWGAFALLWSLKEARGKYTGTGLRAGVREIAVPLPEGGRSLYERDGLFFRIFSGSGWRGAVCAAEAPPEDLIWI